MTLTPAKFRKREALKKKLKIYGGIAAVTGLGIIGALKLDAITKREHLPERKALYRATQQVYYAGGEEHQSSENVDRESFTKIFKGGGVSGDVKTENPIAEANIRIGEKDIRYELRHESGIRLASGTTRNEIVQGGMSLVGARNWQERYATIDSWAESFDRERFMEGSKDNPHELISYKVEPERGTFWEFFTGVDQWRINLEKKDGKKYLINKLTEHRSMILGWNESIEKYRNGTTLEQYTVQSDDPNVEKLFKLFELYNDQSSVDDDQRVDIIKQIEKLEAKIPRRTVYRDYEDGIIDWNFQESTIYLGHNPEYIDRVGIELSSSISDKWLPEMVLRVENKWDLWPGNYWGLRDVRYSDDKRILSLFDKTNNGGYVIKDHIGTIAQIEIEDFLLNYDNDIVYKYYFDKNGNGEIDREKELISQVIYGMSRGQTGKDKKELDEGQGKKDITYDFYYSFMEGYETAPEKAYQDFVTCAWIESLIPSQINRGFGKHSGIGYVKEIRSNIMLLNERTYENLGRNISQENAYVAAQDIYNLLKEAKRPYAEKFGKILGLDKETDTFKKVDSLYVPKDLDTAKTQ